MTIAIVKSSNSVGFTLEMEGGKINEYDGELPKGVMVGKVSSENYADLP